MTQETAVPQTRESILPTSEDHWLDLRTKDLTSTEAAVLFGVSPYLTLFELWHRKKGKLAVDKIQRGGRLAWGNRLQDAIACGIAEDEGWKVRPMKEYIRIPERRLASSFDYSIEATTIEAAALGDVGLQPRPPQGLLEVKNVDAMKFRDGWIVDGDNLEAPPHIELQVQHQLNVSGRSFAYIGALVGGNRVVLIRREPQPDIIAAIEAKAAAFWASIDADEPPAPDFSQDAKTIARLYGHAEPSKVMTVTGESPLTEIVRAYKAAGEAEKAAKERKDAAKAELLTLIGSAEKVKGPGWSISAGIVAGGPVSYVKEPHRDFRVFISKPKEA